MSSRLTGSPSSLSLCAILAAAIFILATPVRAAWEMSEFVIYLWNQPQAGTPEEKARWPTPVLPWWIGIPTSSICSRRTA